MIEASNVFQQYAQEYILSERGSSEEAYFFNKIIETYSPLIKVELSLINGNYYEEFVREVKRRNSKQQIEEVEKMIDGIDIRDGCSIVSYWKCMKSNDKNDSSWKKNQIAAPIYVSVPSGKTCILNPYDEFTKYCLEKYYDEYKDVSLTCAQFDAMSSKEQKEFIVKNINSHIRSDISIEVITDSEGVSVVSFDRVDNDGSSENLFLIATGPASYVVENSIFGENRVTLFIDFRMNCCFDYLFDISNVARIDTDKKCAATGQIIMLNDVPNTDCQLAFALCIMTGLIEFSGYQKFHKFNATKVNGIDSYINQKFNFGGEVRKCFEYNRMFILYSPDGKYNEKTTKIAEVPYTGYSKYIDEFIQQIITDKA